jgi:hypothetical protein
MPILGIMQVETGITLMTRKSSLLKTYKGLLLQKLIYCFTLRLVIKTSSDRHLEYLTIGLMW